MFLKKEIQIVVVGSLLLQSPLILAGDRMYQSNPNTTTTTTTSTATPTGTGTSNDSKLNTYSASSTPVPDTTAINNIGNSGLNNNVLNQGQNASDKQGAGKAIGMASAAFSAGMAAMTCTQKPFNPQCPLWLLGAAAGLAVASKNAKAKGTSNQTVADVTGATATATPVDPVKELESSREFTETEAKIKAAASNVPGMAVNTKTQSVKLPNGKTVSADALFDTNKLAAAGLSQGEIGSYLDGLKKSFAAGEKAVKGMDKAKDASNYEDGSAGGKGGGVASGGSGDPSYGLAGQQAPARDPAAQVAGLSRDFNGEKIGVASDNLFTLINRRYDHQANQNSFLLPKQ